MNLSQQPDRTTPATATPATQHPLPKANPTWSRQSHLVHIHMLTPPPPHTSALEHTLLKGMQLILRLL